MRFEAVGLDRAWRAENVRSGSLGSIGEIGWSDFFRPVVRALVSLELRLRKCSRDLGELENLKSQMTSKTVELDRLRAIHTSSPVL